MLSELFFIQVPLLREVSIEFRFVTVLIVKSLELLKKPIENYRTLEKEYRTLKKN